MRWFTRRLPLKNYNNNEWCWKKESVIKGNHVKYNVKRIVKNQIVLVYREFACLVWAGRLFHILAYRWEKHLCPLHENFLGDSRRMTVMSNLSCYCVGYAKSSWSLSWKGHRVGGAISYRDLNSTWTEIHYRVIFVLFCAELKSLI